MKSMTVARRIAVAAILMYSGSARVHAEAPGFLASYLEARPVIARAVAAAGGAEAINTFGQLQYRYTGSIYNRLQGLDPRKVAAEPLTAALAFDYTNNAFYQSIGFGIPGIDAVASPIFYKNGAVYSLDNFQRQYSVTKGDPGPAFDVPSRFMPAVVLRRLLKNIKSAAWLGDGDVHGRPTDLVEFSWDETTRYRLDFDKVDHTLVALRVLVPDPLVGDDEATIEFMGEQAIGGIRFPKRAVSYRRGEKYMDLALDDVSVNQALDPGKFEVPAGFEELPSKPVVTRRIDTNLYEVSEIGGGTYRSQFIDAGNYVVAFEALLSFGTTQQVIGEIRKTLGDKPIRYVVISHFHNDHAAGVGAYVAAGATVVTTRGNEEVLTRYARAGSVLSGGTRRPGLQPNFLEVTGDKVEVVGEGGRKLVVYRIPGVPHVDDMLTLYDPATRTIVDGDLYAVFFPFSPAYQRFADWLQSADAPDVARIAGVHHPPMTKKAFLDIAAASRAKTR